MNSIQAKKIHIVSFLSFMGIMPEKKRGVSWWYFTPWRSESTPSLKVDRVKNVWFDFGFGRGGDLLGLIQEMQHCNISEALRALRDSGYVFSFDPQNLPGLRPVIESPIKIVSISEIQHPALSEYVCMVRNIPLRYARKYLKELKFTLHEKQYFTLGFENDKGGYELRNRFFKGSTSPKWPTTILGTGDRSLVSIFEGVFDFLTIFKLFGRAPEHDVVVLNSLSFLESINLNNYRTAFCYMDTDIAGRNALNRLKALYGSKIVDASTIYLGWKDANEMICSNSCPLNFRLQTINSQNQN